VQVTPNDPAVLDMLHQIEAHPEIMLSRRELIKYVLATPGDRAQEVQALLHLDQIDKVRGLLQKIANSCDKQLTSIDKDVEQVKVKLLSALGVSELNKEKVLLAVNVQRAIMGLPALPDINKSISLKDGMAVPTPAKPQRIPKVQAIADIKAFRDAVEEITNAVTTERITTATADINTLASDPAILSGVQRETFYSTGIGLLDAELCPFCDTSWSLEDLRKHVQAKRDHLKGVALKRKAIEVKLTPLIITVQKMQAAINPLTGYAALTTPLLAFEAVKEYVIQCKNSATKLTALLPFTETTGILAKFQIIPQAVLDAIDKLEKIVLALPEPTKQDAAREWLILAQERLENYREITGKQKTAKEQALKSRKVFDIYSSTSDSVLKGIYSAVEKDFEALYAFINRGDEDEFKAKLVPSMGKLGFDVDFYGRGFFPPGAYHSEGHQDSMGLCLYLALMRHIHGNSFTFAVLDDVLMSVDAGHRKQVCLLLKKEFPNTQFIMTTHDPIWLRHMKTERLITGQSAVQFRSWHVDHGPALWHEGDVWAEIDDYLKKNDVRSAAGLLRHYLEYISAELCHKLRAPVEFRGDSQYQLGELLPAAIGQMRKLYSRAKAAANSWNQQDVVNQITELESKFGTLAAASSAEQWQLNVAVHYNSWDNLGKADFEPVAKAFRDLLVGFICQDCGEYLHVLPDRETPESIRCECGKINLNLKKKSVPAEAQAVTI